jgi:hypothetical protein
VENGFGSKVRFLPSDNGRWYVSLQLDPSKANRMIIDENGVRSPNGNMRFVAGGDPYKFSKTKYKGSYGGGAVFYKYGPRHLMPEKPTPTNGSRAGSSAPTSTAPTALKSMVRT